MSKIEWLDTALLDGPNLVLCLTEEQYKSVMRKYKIAEPKVWLDDDKNAACHTFTLSGPPYSEMAVICVDEMERSHSQLAGLLIHESVHVAQRYFESIGETRPGREIEAYIIQRIAQNLLFAYEKQSKKLEAK